MQVLYSGIMQNIKRYIFFYNTSIEAIVIASFITYPAKGSLILKVCKCQLLAIVFNVYKLQNCRIYSMI